MDRMNPFSPLSAKCFSKARWQQAFPCLIAFMAVLALMGGGLYNRGFSATVEKETPYSQLLQESWTQYKARFIQQDGRVIDHINNITTSEGQAYAMLRALWSNDQKTFEQSYAWAKRNLQKPRTDHLFAWHWGKQENGDWGVLDTSSASDADQDIALALILANQLWPNSLYCQEAQLILTDLWQQLVIQHPVGPILLPGSWAQSDKGYQLNPSYLAPYAYRVFAEFDKTHDWQSLVNSSYIILEQSMKATTTHLPPDWVLLPRTSRSVILYSDPLDERSDFGYEAIRVYWRLALDSLLVNNNKQAKKLLKRKSQLTRYWHDTGEIPVSLTWDGEVRHAQLKSGALYGAVLPGVYWQNKQIAHTIITRKIAPNLKPDGIWNTKNDYYSQNWLWFGLALFPPMEKTPEPIPQNMPLSKKLLHLMSLQKQ